VGDAGGGDGDDGGGLAGAGADAASSKAANGCESVSWFCVNVWICGG
jgi:hypothetical protein